MTDEEVLAIAAQLWRENDGADFTMDRLVDATGLSRATLYRRFGSRDAILQRLAEEQCLDVEELSRPDIRTRIIQATGAVLNHYGLAGVTVEQIAQEAGVGPATVYRHFGSKEALIEAFVQASSPRVLIRKLTANRESDLEADLTHLATTLLEFIRDNPGLMRAIVLESQGVETVFTHLRATQGRTAIMLAEYLEGHIALGNLKPADPFELALSFTGLLLGLGLVGIHSYGRTITDLQAMAQFATHLFLHGAAMQHPKKLEGST